MWNTRSAGSSEKAELQQYTWPRTIATIVMLWKWWKTTMTPSSKRWLMVKSASRKSSRATNSSFSTSATSNNDHIPGRWTKLLILYWNSENALSEAGLMPVAKSPRVNSLVSYAMSVRDWNPYMIRKWYTAISSPRISSKRIIFTKLQTLVYPAKNNRIKAYQAHLCIGLLKYFSKRTASLLIKSTYGV